MKRTPLRRGNATLTRKPMARGVPLRHAAPGQQSRRKTRPTGNREPRPPGEFTKKVRAAIRARAEDRCEICGVCLPEGHGQFQHIDARGMGGSRDRLTNSVQGGVLACGTVYTGCHGRCEKRDPVMHDWGFVLEPGERPGQRPIRLHGEFGDGRPRWLTPGGGYSLEPPEGVAALCPPATCS